MKNYSTEKHQLNSNCMLNMFEVRFQRITITDNQRWRRPVEFILETPTSDKNNHLHFRAKLSHNTVR